jgi:hypothetical protein
MGIESRLRRETKEHRHTNQTVTGGDVCDVGGTTVWSVFLLALAREILLIDAPHSLFVDCGSNTVTLSLSACLVAFFAPLSDWLRLTLLHQD